MAKTSRSDSLDLTFSSYDNLSTAVTLKHDGHIDFRIVGCIAEVVKAEQRKPEGWARIKEIFRQPCLQIVSMTITEKGYNIMDFSGDYTAQVKREMADSGLFSENTMGQICLLLYERYLAGKFPLTLLSLDNVSHNGSLFRESVLAYAEAWTKAGFLPGEFYDYIADESKISFPWSMIDKITPGPDASVAQILSEKGYEDISAG